MQQGHRRRYSRRRRRRIRQLQLLVAACILVTGVVLACTARNRSKQEAKEAAEAAAAQPVTQELEPDEPPAQNPEPEEEPEPEQDWGEEARYMAQACFGEGWICQSKTEWAAIHTMPAITAMRLPRFSGASALGAFCAFGASRSWFLPAMAFFARFFTALTPRFFGR